MSATSYFENMVLDALLGDNHGASLPATVYVSLFTSAPDDAGGGDEVPETGTGYSRVGVTNDTTHWPMAASGQKFNGVKIQFPMALAPWGDITHFGVHDASSGGNLLVYGEVATLTLPDVGNAPYFDIFALAVTCD